MEIDITILDLILVYQEELTEDVAQEVLIAIVTELVRDVQSAELVQGAIDILQEEVVLLTGQFILDHQEE